MFVSAYGGEGVSTVAREYARCEAAFAKKPVWLVDADLTHQSQMQAVSADQERFGSPGALSQATPDGSVFFTVTPPGREADAHYLVARPFLGRRLWVTRFRHKNLAPGQKIIAINGNVFSKDAVKNALRDTKGNSQPIHLILQADTFVSTAEINYHDGERYPVLERINGTPAYLDDITNPLTKQETPSK